ncbi:MAG: bifunctional pyr operon transcriptional regulator/uracil phosphoribosyltransferase PyrR [Candidatus Omnitrophota bacterium]
MWLLPAVCAVDKLILDAPAMERAITRMAHEILEKNSGNQQLALIGIHTRGVILAERLHKALRQILQEDVPMGTLDINLYRDDLTMVAEQPIIRKTEIDFEIDDLTVVLVDDVLYTGRTVRAALDALIDLGRPRRIQLAVLIDRGHRELPIRADFVGKNIPTSEEEVVHVRFTQTDDSEEVVVGSQAESVS